jgi:hypothetical protein
MMCEAVAGVAVVASDTSPAPEIDVIIQDCDVEEQYEGVSLAQFMSTLIATPAESSADQSATNILTVHSDPPVSPPHSTTNLQLYQPKTARAHSEREHTIGCSSGTQPGSTTASTPADTRHHERAQTTEATETPRGLQAAHSAGSLVGSGQRSLSWGILPRPQFESMPDVELRPGTALVASGSGRGCCDTGREAAVTVTEVSLADMAPKLFAAHTDAVV